MYVVNIGYHCELLMPADKGMKLVTLLQESMLVKLDYHSTSRNVYVAGDVPEVQYSSVKADQVVMPNAASTPQRRKGPLLLGSD
jgi:pyruvate/2-oxoglutarate dehydrogenase complex dihydrolipoamide dehydrogenase (E3) component